MTPQSGTFKRDFRPRAIVLLAGSIFAFALLIQYIPSRGVEVGSEPPPESASPFGSLNLTTTARDAKPRPESSVTESGAPLSPRLRQALAGAESAIKHGRHDEAIRTLNRVRDEALGSSAAFHLIGKALIGKGDFATARDFLSKAIDLDPTRAEAYFDHARASEGLNDLPSALGGMRSYLHVETNSDPYRLRIAQARSAIWEWEAQLGRGPWGPTRGIPPGFTADMLKRDGKGVGVMMQKPETLKPDGSMEYEIRAGELQTHLFKP